MTTETSNNIQEYSQKLTQKDKYLIWKQMFFFIIIIIVCAMSFYFGFNYRASTSLNLEKNSKVMASPTPPGIDNSKYMLIYPDFDMSTWKEYKSDDFGFSFLYPNNYSVTVRSQSANSIWLEIKDMSLKAKPNGVVNLDNPSMELTIEKSNETLDDIILKSKTNPSLNNTRLLFDQKQYSPRYIVTNEIHGAPQGSNPVYTLQGSNTIANFSNGPDLEIDKNVFAQIINNFKFK